MQRLRILHVIPRLGIGGAENIAAYLLLGLSQWHEVGVVSLYHYLENGLVGLLIKKGIQVYSLQKKSGLDARMFWAVNRIFKRFQPQVVHTHLSVLRYVLPSLLIHKIPLALHTLHNLAEYETDSTGRLINRIAFRRRVLPITISCEVELSLRRVYGIKSAAMIPNGIPVERYGKDLSFRAAWRKREGIDDRAIVFMCVGRLHRQKNPLLLIRAFAALVDIRNHLVFVGSGPLAEPLRAAARTSGLEKRIHFLGGRHDIPNCLAAADAFVLASDWEGNPLSVMEAMASGLPVISTAVGGIPELLQSGQEGILVQPGDTDAFSKAMDLLAVNERMRIEMGKAGQLRAHANFAVERMVNAYNQFCQTAITLPAGHKGDSLCENHLRYR